MKKKEQQDWVAFISQPYWVKVMVEVAEVGSKVECKLTWTWVWFEVKVELGLWLCSGWGWDWFAVEFEI